jgi:hypothetical protein
LVSALDDYRSPYLESIQEAKQAMDNNYVSVVDDVYRISGTGVSLDSIVYDYLSGLSPESIADNFDSCPLSKFIAPSLSIFLTGTR